jgi:hypothetical protein
MPGYYVWFFGILIISAMPVQPVYAQNDQESAPVLFEEIMPFVITTGSSIWLEGSASVVNFECRVRELRTVGGLVGMDTLAAVPRPHGNIHLEVHIPIDKMDCGRSGINRDMKNTLDAARFPYIIYHLERNIMRGYFQDNEHHVFDINTWGKLQISGQERMEEIPIKGTFLGPWRFRIEGAHRVNMRDFGIEPPTPMMGLIKVDEMLTVHFDVTLCLRSCEAMVILE